MKIKLPESSNPIQMISFWNMAIWKSDMAARICYWLDKNKFVVLPNLQFLIKKFPETEAIVEFNVMSISIVLTFTKESRKK